MSRLTDRFNRAVAAWRGEERREVSVHRPRMDVARARQAPCIGREPWLGRAFGELAEKLIKALRREHTPFARVARAWAHAAPELQEETAITAFSQGTLEVGVADQVLRSELQSFMAPSLLHALRETPEGSDVDRLTFKLLPRSPL